MKILITGHKGAVGSRLWQRLEQWGTDHYIPGQYDLVGIDTRDGTDLLTCELPENVDLIFHLAAHASVEESWKDPVRSVDNLATTIRLIHHYPNTRIVFAATCAGLDPKSPYAFSKRAAQNYLKTFHSNYVTCVFPNIFGTGRSVADYFKGKDKVIIYGDGSAKRDYVHVDDIVKGLDKARFWDTGEYMMGGGTVATVLELAERKEVDFQPTRREAKESLIPNTTPDWKPKINVLDYINE